MGFELHMVALLLLLLSFPVYADHNSHVDGYSSERGYNKQNCEALASKVTNKQAEWLGHLIGCIVNDGDKDVLIMEYSVIELNKIDGDKLRQLVEEYEDANNKRIEM